ncbi:hypothetical protein Tco_0713039, partial [Tanacetum coccineum]
MIWCGEVGGVEADSSSLSSSDDLSSELSSSLAG